MNYTTDIIHYILYNYNVLCTVNSLFSKIVANYMTQSYYFYRLLTHCKFGLNTVIQLYDKIRSWIIFCVNGLSTCVNQ